MIDFERLLNDLRHAESPNGEPILRSYQDTKGVWTIGHGRNLQTMTITANQAEEWLLEDAERAYVLLTERLPWISELTAARIRALVELTFNMGLGDSRHGLLSFEQGSLAKLQAGDYDGAAHGFLHSMWAQQVGPHRAERIAQMLREGR